MNDLRTLIQARLSAIEGLDVGVPKPDDMIEDNKTYFGYELQNDYVGSDFDRNYSMQVSIIGHLVRKNNNVEDTLYEIDYMLEQVTRVLKGLNIRYSIQDVTIDDNVRKIFINGHVRYNEINYWLT